MPSIDYTQRLAARLAAEKAERERDDASLKESSDENFEADPRDALASALMKSAAQVGTVGGKTADASPVSEMADRLSGSRAKYHQGLVGQVGERGRRRELDTKVMQYLAEKQDRATAGEAEARKDAEQTAYNRSKDAADRKLRQDAIAAATARRDNKPSNDVQLQSASFGKRAIAASKIADDLLVSGYDPTTLGTQLRSAIPGVNKWTMTENDKIMDNAQRDFVSAVLRKESGAAIPEPELESEKIKYFPQANDSEQLLANKKQLRQRAIEGLKAQAGSGWDNVADVAGVTVPRKPGAGEAVAAPADKDPGEMTDEELDAELLRLGGGG